MEGRRVNPDNDSGPCWPANGRLPVARNRPDRSKERAPLREFSAHRTRDLARRASNRPCRGGGANSIPSDPMRWPHSAPEPAGAVLRTGSAKLLSSRWSRVVGRADLAPPFCLLQGFLHGPGMDIHPKALSDFLNQARHFDLRLRRQRLLQELADLRFELVRVLGAALFG